MWKTRKVFIHYMPRFSCPVWLTDPANHTVNVYSNVAEWKYKQKTVLSHSRLNSFKWKNIQNRLLRLGENLDFQHSITYPRKWQQKEQPSQLKVYMRLEIVNRIL